MEIFGIPSQALFGQLLIGLINGSFYALLSLGLAVIFGLLNIINFTHGAQYMMGAFCSYFLLQYAGVGYWWSLLLAPLALGWLLHASHGGTAVMGSGPWQMALILASGAATTLPLVLFGHAARRISLTTLGILQFLGPTLQFGIGWWFYAEPMSVLRLASFGLIWLAIAVYATERGRVDER